MAFMLMSHCSVSSCRVLALNVPSTWMPSRQIYIGLAVLLPLDFYPEVSNNLPHTSSTLCSLYQLLFFSMGLITSIHCLFSNVLPNRSFLRAGILSIAFTAISSASRTVAGMWKMLYIYELIFFFLIKDHPDLLFTVYTYDLLNLICFYSYKIFY